MDGGEVSESPVETMTELRPQGKYIVLLDGRPYYGAIHEGRATISVDSPLNSYVTRSVRVSDLGVRLVLRDGAWDYEHHYATTRSPSP